jgi:hypothetical protein
MILGSTYGRVIHITWSDGTDMDIGTSVFASFSGSIATDDGNETAIATFDDVTIAEAGDEVTGETVPNGTGSDGRLWLGTSGDSLDAATPGVHKWDVFGVTSTAADRRWLCGGQVEIKDPATSF